MNEDREPVINERRLWRTYALIAIIGLAAAIILGLTACGSDACNGHGGVHMGPVKGWYLCNDSTWQPWSA